MIRARLAGFEVAGSAHFTLRLTDYAKRSIFQREPALLTAWGGLPALRRMTAVLRKKGVRPRLAKPEIYDILSDMKTVTLRRLRREADLLDWAAGGEEIIVTRFGRPYVRIVAARQPRTFVGAGQGLGARKPVSPQPVPKSEWNGLA